MKEESWVLIMGERENTKMGMASRQRFTMRRLNVEKMPITMAGHGIAYTVRIGDKRLVR